MNMLYKTLNVHPLYLKQQEISKKSYDKDYVSNIISGYLNEQKILFNKEDRLKLMIKIYDFLLLYPSYVSDNPPFSDICRKKLLYLYKDIYVLTLSNRKYGLDSIRYYYSRLFKNRDFNKDYLNEYLLDIKYKFKTTQKKLKINLLVIQAVKRWIKLYYNPENGRGFELSYQCYLLCY